MIIPQDRVGVEVLGRVEPEHVPHLPPTQPILVHVRLYQIRLTGPVTQELEIHLVPRRPRPILRAHLHHFPVLASKPLT